VSLPRQGFDIAPWRMDTGWGSVRTCDRIRGMIIAALFFGSTMLPLIIAICLYRQVQGLQRISEARDDVICKLVRRVESVERKL
jgi:hypothetical protein